MTDYKEWREKAERRVREYDKCERIGGNVSAYCSLFGLDAHILLKSALAKLNAQDKEIERLTSENKGLREEYTAQVKAFDILEAECRELANKYRSMIQDD